MNEEKLLILKMVEEGKITAQEAAALIDALEGTEKAGEVWSDEAEKTETGSHSFFEKKEKTEENEKWWTRMNRIWEKLEKMGDSEFTRRLEEEATRFGKNVEEAAEKFARVLEERIQRDVRPALANLPEFLANLPVIGELAGQFAIVTDEVTGMLAGEHIKLDLNTKDGFIEVEGWEEDHYRLIMRKKVRGADEASARQRAAEIVQLTESSDSLQLTTRPGLNEAVSIRLNVPQGKIYDLDLEACNGHIKLVGLKLGSGKVITSNGRVAVKDVQGDRLFVQTSNGGLESDRVTAAELTLMTSNGKIKAAGNTGRLEARTSNGSIRVWPQADAAGTSFREQSLDLHTSNGSIGVKLPESLQDACWLDAGTTFSSINVGLDNLNYHLDERKLGNNRVQAETPGFASSDVKVRIVARTKNGSINIEKA